MSYKSETIQAVLPRINSSSFPGDVFEILKGGAKKKKVTLGWVPRNAAERYVAGQSLPEPD